MSDFKELVVGLYTVDNHDYEVGYVVEVGLMGDDLTAMVKRNDGKIEFIDFDSINEGYELFDNEEAARAQSAKDIAEEKDALEEARLAAA